MRDSISIIMSKEKLKTASEAHTLLTDAGIHTLKEGGKSERDAVIQRLAE